LLKYFILFCLVISFNTYSVAQWEQAGLSNKWIAALVDKNNSIFAGSDSIIFRSMNSGASWDTLARLNSHYISILTNFNNVLFVGNSRGVYGTSPPTTCIFRSINNGISWDSVYAEVLGTTQIQAYGGNIFANADGQLIRSTDDGLNWEVIQILSGEIISIASNDKFLFVSVAQDSIYRSDDNGITLISLGNGLPSFTNWSLVAKEDTIYTVSDSIYMSIDNGENWVSISQGFPDDKTPFGLYYFRNYLFVTTMDNHIYMTSLSNINWVNVSEGLVVTGHASIYILILHKNYIFAGTHSGVWRRPLLQLVSLDFNNSFLIDEFKLEQNYPNPLNPVTNIRYQVPKETSVIIEIFNVLGQKVRTLVNEFKAEGYYTFVWDGKDDFEQPLSSGIYLYRMTAGEFVNVKKMIMLR
jgi:photosystem II stability/assembly factor-like uncharacterized protein